MTGLDRLTAAYGAPLPSGLSRLDPADADHLADLIQSAHHRQRAALAEATENGLRFIPRLLRGPVKKTLFG